jgi:hypothetical protein
LLALSIATCSRRRRFRLTAYPLCRPCTPTFDDRSPAVGRCFHSSAWRPGVGGFPRRTWMDTQLSKCKRTGTFPLILPGVLCGHRFRANGSHQRKVGRAQDRCSITKPPATSPQPPSHLAATLALDGALCRAGRLDARRNPPRSPQSGPLPARHMRAGDGCGFRRLPTPGRDLPPMGSPRRRYEAAADDGLGSIRCL